MISPSIPEIPSPVSLAVIVVVLAGSVILSLLRPAPPRPGPDAQQEAADRRPDETTEAPQPVDPSDEG